MKYNRSFNTYILKILFGIMLGFTAQPISFATNMEDQQVKKLNNVQFEQFVEPNLTKILSEFSFYAEQVRNDWKIPGMAIAIVQGDNIVYTEGFGERNTNHAPVTPDTIFNIASLTKSFTATLLAMQIDEGKYQWDTKVIDLYPNFKLYSSKTTNQFEISDLISHRSGLPESALNELFNFGYSANHMIYALRYIKPIASFRNSFAYQNLFLLLAQKIIEKDGDQNYARILNKKIFLPLKMENSNVLSYGKLAKLENVAQPNVYYEGNNYPFVINESLSSVDTTQNNNDNVGAASGGINSSVKDLGKWLIFNINSGKKNNTQLVSKKNMDFLHSPQTIIKKSKNGEILEAYGEGWYIDKSEFQPHTVLYHPGGNLGVHSIMAYIPDKKIGIVILTNQQPNMVPEIIYKRFFDLYLNRHPLKDWNKIYLQEREKSNKSSKNKMGSYTCKKTKNQTLEKYTGIYYNPIYEKVTIVQEKNHLVLSIGPNNTKLQLIPCENHVFKINWPNPNGMPIPMISEGPDTLHFLEDPKSKEIKKLIIPFLNKHPLGIFKKQK